MGAEKLAHAIAPEKLAPPPALEILAPPPTPVISTKHDDVASRGTARCRRGERSSCSSHI
jgi:hypothetical protein